MPARSKATIPASPHLGAALERARTAGPKQTPFIGSGTPPSHTRRADRHAGNGKACRVRFLGKEARQRSGGYVSLDDIARDFRRVAGGEIVWNAEPSLHRIEVPGVQNFCIESRLLKVLDPT